MRFYGQWMEAQILHHKQKGEAGASPFTYMLINPVDRYGPCNYFAAWVVSTAAGAWVVSAGACSVVVSAFFFAHPLIARTDTETQSMITTNAISFFNTFHLLISFNYAFLIELLFRKTVIKYTKKI